MRRVRQYPRNTEKEKLEEALLISQGGKILHTKAQRANIQILTERPKDMPLAEYKLRMRKQTKDIKNLLR
jgi:hypothetical protein